MTKQSAQTNSEAKVVRFPERSAERSREEIEFLPAALEIVESPPSPIGHAIGATIVALFVVALAWTCFGQIDIVASAPGKVIPTGRIKVVQPFETGVVRAIRVADGASVKAGDVLIELDPTINEGEKTHLESDRSSAELDIARIHAALADTDDPLSAFHPPDAADPALVANQKQYLLAQVAEQHAKLTALDRQATQKQAELATIKATISKLEAVIPTIEERVNIRKTLIDKEYGNKLQYYEVLQLLTETQQERLVQASRSAETEAALATIAQTRAQTAAEFRRTLLGENAEAERKAAGFTADLSRVTERTRLQLLTAPVDGIVQQLAVHTVGGVVTPAQALLVVVPSDSHLEIEAMVTNHDIGFVRAGLDAEIKVDTFDFTRYGLLHGKVRSVSQDAIVRDNSTDKSAADRQPGSVASTSEPRGQELSYSARITLDQTQIDVDGTPVNLSPGMAVTVEVKTGSRRIISYLLSPLLRYRQNSLRER
jgi:membrane fusion protein, hemolysin D